jgi:DNA polymerase III delta subunit
VTPAAKRPSKIDILDFLATPPERMSSLVVLHGREHILADDAVRAIVGSVFPDASLRDPNVDAVDAAAIESSGDIVGKLATLPFLSERRVVVVRGSTDLKKDARDEIIAACKDVPDHAILVVDHSGKPARPQGRKPAAEAGEFASATRGSITLECTLDQTGCARYIESRLSTLDAKIDAEAKAALAATEDVAEIKNALDRLTLTTKRIRLADVKDYAVPAHEAKLWDLGDAVNAGDVAKAVSLARELSENAIGPLQWLATDAQVIWELSRGARYDEYARATAQNAWRIGKLSGAARMIKPAVARRNVDITMKALERCLTGRREPAQTLEEVIVRLCESPK